MAVSLFISYSTPDGDYVAHLAARLEAAGLTPWWFEAKQKAGRIYNKELMRRIAAAHAVVLIVSAASADSQAVLQEVKRTRRERKLLIPVVIGPEISGRVIGDLSGVVIYEIDHLDCINGRGERDPLPRLIDALTPDRPSELHFDALDLDPTAPPNHLAGKSLKHYLIDLRVSVTRQSMVFRAVEPLVGRQVAIKVVRPELASQPAYIRRFADEARRIARLDHPHILKLYTFWRNDSGAYLVMPWMSGGTLEQLRHEGPLPLARVLRLCGQIAAALAYAHRHGVIHCDLKPANLLRDANDNIFLADFSIAQGISQATVGFTIGYAPPEQVAGAPAAPQTDIYSLGVILLELLTGQPVFTGDPATILERQRHNPPRLRDTRPDLPEALDAVLQQALAPEPANRFATVMEFAAAVHASVATAPATDAPVPAEALRLPDALAPTNPYKGLAAFDEGDALVFFGRTHLTAQLVGRLRADGVDGRFLAVAGPSGSGKSSVIHAGLLPALRAGAVPGSQHWFVTAMTPGTAPVRNLVAALEYVTVTHLDAAEQQILATAQGLAEVINAALPPDPAIELLLVIDQFEELFTQSQTTMQMLLLASLALAVQAPQSRLRLVITLRGDFYDRPLQVPDFGTLLQTRTQWILPLNETELVQAIVAPAERVGVTVETDVLGAMVADVEDQPGTLPLLQYALYHLFQRREDDRLTYAAYQATGGVAGALSSTAEALYAASTPTQRDLTRQIFLRLLMLGDDGVATRRRVRQSELRALVQMIAPTPIAATGTTVPADAITKDAAEWDMSAIASPQPVALIAARPDPATMADLEAILERYGTARLLTFDYDPSSREPTVEVAHEALLDAWRRLRDDWLAGAQDELRTRQRLSEAADEWQQRNHDSAYLERGGRLAQYAELAAVGSMTLTDRELRFVEASLAERDRNERLERERLERELRLERERAAEREAANRKLRRRAIGLGISLALALAALGSAGWFGLESRRQGQAALGRQMLVHGTTLVDERPLLGLRMMLEGLDFIAENQQEAVKDLLEAPLWQARQGRVRLVATDGNNDPLDSTWNLHAPPDRSVYFLARTGQPGELHNTQTGEVTILSAETDWVRFSTYGSWAIVRYPEQVGELRNLASGEIIPLPGVVVGTTYFSPDSEWVLIQYGVTATQWTQMRAAGTPPQFTSELRNLRTQATIPFATQKSPIFSPQGSWVFLLDLEGSDEIRHLETGEVIPLQHEAAFFSTTFSPDGTQLLIGYENAPPELRDLASGDSTPLSGNPTGVIAGRYWKLSEDKVPPWVVLQYTDRPAELWRVGGDQRFSLSRSDPTQMMLSFDDHWARIVFQDGSVELWDLQAGVATAVPSFGGFSPDYRWAITDDSAAGLRQLRNLDTGKVTVLPGRINPLSRTDFSQDSRFFWGSNGSYMEIWELGDEPQYIGSLGTEVSDVFVYPKTLQALVAYQDGKVYQIDLAMLKTMSDLGDQPTVTALTRAVCERLLVHEWSAADQAELEQLLPGREPQACRDA